MDNCDSISIGKKEPQVTEWLGALGATVDLLDESTEALRADLAPVLRGEFPDGDMPCGTGENIVLCPLADQLRGINQHLQRISTTIMAVRAKLEL